MFNLESLKNAPWRIIPPQSAAGALHMKVDLWLLEQHRQGRVPSTLRFYTWSPPAISLGFHQRIWPDAWNSLQWQDQAIDLVRRPTGGRAVLHQGDLTYAIITSDQPGNRQETYRYLCEFLVAGWRSLGVELTYGVAGRGYIHNPNCFGTATNADLVTSTGYKFIGSAQLRRGNAILQHGSMRLAPDANLFQQVFGGDRPMIPPHPQWEFAHIRETLTQAASAWFQAPMLIAPLSEQEWQEIHAFEPPELALIRP
jgi:lipoate-protein ligase A